MPATGLKTVRKVTVTHDTHLHTWALELLSSQSGGNYVTSTQHKVSSDLKSYSPDKLNYALNSMAILMEGVSLTPSAVTWNPLEKLIATYLNLKETSFLQTSPLYLSIVYCDDVQQILPRGTPTI